MPKFRIGVEYTGYREFDVEEDTEEDAFATGEAIADEPFDFNELSFFNFEIVDIEEVEEEE